MSSVVRGAGSLARTMTRGQAVAIGMGSMIGAGLFVVWTPAAQAAGYGVLLSLLVVAVVAACNAYSSAMLATRYPRAGGAYVYGRERLGDLPGYLAGWCFLVGKSASCAAMALTIGFYLAPGYERLAAVVAVVGVTIANLSGLQRSAVLSRAIVVIVLSVLAGLAVSVLVASVSAPDGAAVFDLGVGGGAGWATGLGSGTQPTAYGVVQAAGLLFFAFAGYARIATLAEEVRDPQRTIAQAIGITFVAVLIVYVGVAVLVFGVLGTADVASSNAPVADVAAAVWPQQWVWLIRCAATCAALGALLNMLLGVSRTTLAMARDKHLPGVLAQVGGPHHLPQTAEVVVATVVVITVVFLDLRGAIGFSGFGVLLYYAVANASAWTLPGDKLWQRVVPVVGLLGCLLLVAALPWTSIVAGAAVLTAGICWYAVNHSSRMT